MMRRLAAMLVLVLLAGCSGGGNPPVETPSGSAGPDGSAASETTMADDIQLVAATAPRLTGTPADAASAGAAIDAFGLDLYRLVAGGDRDGNLVISPVSIALGLAMARPGARGETAGEMDAVLHDVGTDGHAAWVAALDAALNARTGSFQDRTGAAQPVTLRIVNAPFAQRGLALEPAYLDALAARFDAGLRLVDYRGAPDAAREAINRWVADRTEQRIRTLLAPGAIDVMTRLVLVNAIYLKAAWQLPFQDAATVSRPFTRADGSTVDVPMMSHQDQFAYAAGAGWRAVELPYVGDRLALLVIVPDDLAAFEGSLDGPTLDAVVASLAPCQVTLGLPRFGIETQTELSDALAALGMPTAFSDRADFSGITTQEALQIAAVVHQANIDVDEAGTEAAAATAVIMRALGMPADPVTLTVDRPFVFALRDLETGAVVFLGRVADPSVVSGA
jgi:serpin B